MSHVHPTPLSFPPPPHPLITPHSPRSPLKASLTRFLDLLLTTMRSSPDLASLTSSLAAPADYHPPPPANPLPHHAYPTAGPSFSSPSHPPSSSSSSFPSSLPHPLPPPPPLPPPSHYDPRYILHRLLDIERCLHHLTTTAYIHPITATSLTSSLYSIKYAMHALGLEEKTLEERRRRRTAVKREDGRHRGEGGHAGEGDDIRRRKRELRHVGEHIHQQIAALHVQVQTQLKHHPAPALPPPVSAPFAAPSRPAVPSPPPLTQVSHPYSVPLPEVTSSVSSSTSATSPVSPIESFSLLDPSPFPHPPPASPSFTTLADDPSLFDFSDSFFLSSPLPHPPHSDATAPQVRAGAPGVAPAPCSTPLEELFEEVGGGRGGGEEEEEGEDEEEEGVEGMGDEEVEAGWEGGVDEEGESRRGRRRRGRYHSEELAGGKRGARGGESRGGHASYSSTPPLPMTGEAEVREEGEAGDAGEGGVRGRKKAGRRRKRDDYAEALHAYPRQYSAFPKLPSELDNPHELPPSHHRQVAARGGMQRQRSE